MVQRRLGPPAEYLVTDEARRAFEEVVTLGDERDSAGDLARRAALLATLEMAERHWKSGLHAAVLMAVAETLCVLLGLGPAELEALDEDE
jgi:hypothetical protein